MKEKRRVVNTLTVVMEFVFFVIVNMNVLFERERKYRRRRHEEKQENMI